MSSSSRTGDQIEVEIQADGEEMTGHVFITF